MRSSPISPLLARDGARLGDRHQAVARKLAPRAAEPRGARDPDDGLQVAQSARAFLDVGLEVVRRVVVLEMPLLLLERLRVVERAHVERRRRTRRSKSRGRAGASRRAAGARAGSCAPSRRPPSRPSHSRERAHRVAELRRRCPTAMPSSRSMAAARGDVGRPAAAGSARRRPNAGTAGRVRSRRPRRAPPRRACRLRRQTSRDDLVGQPREAAQQAWRIGAARRTRRAARRVARAVARASARRAAARRAAASQARDASDARLRRRFACAHCAAIGFSPAWRRRRRARRLRQDLVAVLRDEHRVLPLRRQRVVGGDDRPAVGEAADARHGRR